MTPPSPHPRRHPPAVYRRRRTVVLLALLAVVALVWVLIAQPWRGAAEEGGSAAAPDAPEKSKPVVATSLPVPAAASPSPKPKPTSVAKPKPTSSPKPTSAPSPTPKATPPEGEDAPAALPCGQAAIQVEAATDKTSYSATQKPKLSITLTNLGEEDCTLNVGTSTQKFVITSGSDTWWQSTDCQTEPTDQVVLLAAGQSVSSASPVVWDRTRSSVKSCDDPKRPRAPGGGASYHLSVEIAGVPSDDTALFLLY